MHLLALYLTAILIQRYQIRFYSLLVYYPVHIYILLYYSESVSRVHYYNGFSLQFITNCICSMSIRLLYDDATLRSKDIICLLTLFLLETKTQFHKHPRSDKFHKCDPIGIKYKLDIELNRYIRPIHCYENSKSTYYFQSLMHVDQVIIVC